MLRSEQLRLIPAVMAVTLLLATARWGSHLGIPPLYIGDVLVLFALLNLLIRRMYSVTKSPDSASEFHALRWILWVVLYAGFRYLISGNWGDLNTIRDAVPYTLYAALGLVSGMNLGDAATRERTFKVLYYALGFHAAWVTAVSVFHVAPFKSPIGNLLIFEVRTDFDYPMTAAFAALVVVKIYTSEKRQTYHFAMLAMCTVTIVQPVFISRASILGCLAVFAAVLVVVLYSPNIKRGWAELTAALLPLATLVMVPVFAASKFGQRLFSTFNDDPNSANNGYATANARRDAWATLNAWTDQTPFRSVFGEGFSTDIMKVSGAGDKLALGATEAGVRSPHNYWYGTHAHLGYVGMVLVLIPVAVLLWSFWKNRAILATDPFRLTVYLIPIAMIFPASFGVILESPFGAVPYWWCLGAVFVLDQRDANARERAERERAIAARKAKLAKAAAQRSGSAT